jgi:hypothetical protein
MDPRLPLASLLLQHVSDEERARFLHHHDKALEQEQGFRWCDCRTLVEEAAVRLAFGGFGGSRIPRLLEEVEFNLVELHEGFRPHLHKRSDSVIVVHAPFNAARFETLLDVPAPRAYHPLFDRQVLYRPRGLVHDVRRRKPEILANQFCWLLVASYPAIAEDDTVYV